MFSNWNPLDFNPWAAACTVGLILIAIAAVIIFREMRKIGRDARAWRESQDDSNAPIILPTTWSGMPPENTDRVQNWRKRVSDLDKLPYDPNEPL